jgi:transcriptional regulator with XRE-family HTH domain
MLPDKTYRAICGEVIRLLREGRQARGLSKYAMAKRAGLSEQMIGYVECGKRNPSLETIVRMAVALEVDVSELIRRAFKTGSKSK